MARPALSVPGGWPSPPMRLTRLFGWRSGSRWERRFQAGLKMPALAATGVVEGPHERQDDRDHRRRARGPHGGRRAVCGRLFGNGLRGHADRRAKVPARRQVRAQHHPFGGLREFPDALRRRGPKAAAGARRLHARRRPLLGRRSRHGNLCRLLGPGLSEGDEGLAAAPLMASPAGGAGRARPDAASLDRLFRRRLSAADPGGAGRHPSRRGTPCSGRRQLAPPRVRRCLGAVA